MADLKKLGKDEVAYVAKLSNLKLTEIELEKFGIQLASIIDFIRKLQEVDTEDIEPTSQTTGLVSVMREDKTVPSFKVDDVFYSTEKRFNDFFVIERLLTERGEK